MLDKDLGTNLFKDFPHRLRQGSAQVVARKLGAVHPVLVGDEQDADVGGAMGPTCYFTGLVFEDGAANIAEYYGIPLATLHYFPLRPNGQLLPYLPAPLSRSAMNAIGGWL